MCTGCFCTCLSFQTETVHHTWQKTLSPNYCVQIFLIMRKVCTQKVVSVSIIPTTRWLKRMFALFTEIPTFSPCHDPLVRPTPAPLISSISGFTGSGTDRSFQLGRAHNGGLYSPHWSLFTTCPCTPAPSLIILHIPIPWCLWSSASWSIFGIISPHCCHSMGPLNDIFACLLCHSCCVYGQRLCWAITVWFRCVFTCFITPNPKAQSLKGDMRIGGGGSRLSYCVACILLTMNNVVEQRSRINFCVKLSQWK